MNIFKIKIIVILIFIILKQNNYSNSNQISLDNSLGNNQGYHPKIIYFNNLWNGFKYWMVFTPYPYGDETKENPVINVSNDLKKWFSPKGIHNPLDIPLNCSIKQYNSDTHLLFNNDSNQLELFWRYVNDVDNKVVIYRIKSNNGINWNRKEVFLKSDNRKKLDFVSPVINYDEKIYKIWYVNHKQIYYIEKNKNNFTEPRRININYDNNYYTWHIDLIYNKEKNLYELITCGYKKKIRNMPLFYISSENNINWTTPIKILKPCKEAYKFDSYSLYRSSLIYENGIYYLIYSAHNKYLEVGIGIMFGKDITKLNPFI